MKELKWKEQIKHNLIVSCQALDDEPLHSSFIMSRMALAARQGGAKGLRANSVEDIKEIKKLVDLPVIGIIKRDYKESDVFITATIKEVDELMTVEPEIIAVDATYSRRPNNETLDEFYQAIRSSYPKVALMADCSTFEEMKKADQLGFDFIGTTLVGYTKQSKGNKIEADDFSLIKKAVKELNTPIIAEGNIDTPAKTKRVLDIGVYSVVVGSAITRPQLITEKFVAATK
ncbi:N-acetylmannosamine-6-phosphate 2-epimerase [Tetragenococcus koreensis]|uniref:N-acetylmannosamine-6-phosphate 2-epimerase n=1 Tax=Tetragenococcus koreensis TaxID=290335 RepID=UPI001F3F0EAF|nr:N-acetylmannosamine-6-phosphate 2-epimerase [Tetragenococcus koreensis]MCF1620485.1 N-acetylmannosamine-6-phosphate 2-epimerase [Tetragenococcus koreensis]MCF1657983.1 N-acetylmannosamine-6-phosphate 2-epimerase [Tetragenococcus koreensis]